MSKKLRVKDLKHDPFRDAVFGTGAKAVGWIETHGRLLAAAAGGLVLAATVAGVIAWRLQSRDHAAQSDLAAALKDRQAAADAAVSPPAEGADPAPSWEQVETRLREVADTWPRHPAGRVAAYQVGLVQLESGRASEAATTLAAFVERHPSDWLTPLALAALAAAQEQAGDPTAAEATWNRLAGQDWRNWSRAASLAQLAGLHERQGRIEDARRIYQQLADDPEQADTVIGAQATAKLDELDQQ